MARRRPARAERQIPDAIMLRYVELLSDILSPMLTETLERLRPMLAAKLEAQQRTDAVPGDAQRLLDELRERFTSALGADAIEEELFSLASSVDGFHTSRLSEVLGFDVSALGQDVSETLTEWVRENVSHPEHGITTIPERFLDDVGEEIDSAFQAGERWEDLADRIEERFGVSESDAERIAVDQVGKLNGQLNEQRQTDVGITQYIWRTSNDTRVRPEHEERDGEIFDWDSPPDDGHPGQPIRCRCYADPVLPADLQ